MLKPATCSPCSLYNISNGFSHPEGKGTARVIVMGEALGWDEYIDGLPFRPRAQAGSKLEECIRSVGDYPGLGPITRNSFVLWNIIGCNPPDNKLHGSGYADSAIKCCSQYRTAVIRNFQKRIRQQEQSKNGGDNANTGQYSNGHRYDNSGSIDNHIDNLRGQDGRQRIGQNGHTSNTVYTSNDSTNPRRSKIVILALGNTAFQTLTSEQHSVLDVAGYPFQHYDASNGAKSPQDEVIVIGSYHPSYIKRGNAHLTPLLTEDIKIAIANAQGDRISKAEYLSKCRWNFVGHDEAEAFYYHCRDNQRKIIVHDIETATSGYVPEDERSSAEYSSTVGSLDPNDDITQIQFATDKYNAVVFPNFDGKYRAVAKKIMELPNVKANHNTWNFDNPRLREKYGFKIDESRMHDTMWMFKKWYPKLPAGLQRIASLAGFPFAWKHLFGADAELYGGADVCAVHWILEWLPALMKQRGCWEGYYRYVYQLHPMLDKAASTERIKIKSTPEEIASGKPVEVEISNGGLPVNNSRRIELHRELVERQRLLDIEVQKLVPNEIRNITPKHQCKVKTGEFVEKRTKKKGSSEVTIKQVAVERKIEGAIDYGYVKEIGKLRTILTEARFRYEAAIQKIKAKGISSDKNPIGFEAFVFKAYGLERREVTAYNRKTGEPKAGIDGDSTVLRWVKILPFKASKDQLIRYIKWKKATLAASSNREDRVASKRYDVPKDHKGKETTRKDEVELLFDKTGDELLQMVLEHRSLTTNIRNYIPNWEPSIRTGCVHTTWGYTAASGQINSSAPNTLNVSKHTEIGQLFRRIIEAPEGWEFIELDKKSFHVATFGYCSNDKDYIRFSQLDPHSIFVSYIMPSEWGKPIDLSLSDGEILERCAWIKKRCKQRAEELGKPHGDIRQYQAKPTVLGNQLGLGYRKLYWQNRRSMESEKDAQRFQGILGDLFPKGEAWKNEIKMQGARATYLINEFSCIDHYFDVFNFRWNKRRADWDRSEGDEARNPVAFRVQGCAFGMIKEELYRIMPRLAYLPYYPFRMSVHDSLVFLVRSSDRRAVLSIALEEMQRPCAKLVNDATGPAGLCVGVEWSYGQNLMNYHPERNPMGMREGKVIQ